MLEQEAGGWKLNQLVSIGCLIALARSIYKINTQTLCKTPKLSSITALILLKECNRRRTSTDTIENAHACAQLLKGKSPDRWVMKSLNRGLLEPLSAW